MNQKPQKPFLKRVYIEITNCCNLSCSFCPTSQRKLEFMDIKYFENLLDQLVGVTDYIYLHLKGEPMLHPDLIKFLEISHKKKFKVNLTTNGTLIKKWHEPLLQAKALRQISFSLQSFEQKESEQLLTYLTSVFEFAKKAITINKYVELRLWNLESSKNEGNFNKDILAQIESFFELENNLKEEVIHDKGIRLKDHLYLSQSAEFTWPSLDHEKVSDVGTCHGIKQQIGILVDGTIVPCCLDQEGDIVLGKVGETTVIEALNGVRALSMKEKFEQRVLVEELCQRCGYRERFK